MSKRTIVLGDGRRIGLGRYVEAWRQCKRLEPGTPIGRGVSGWNETAEEALRALRYGLHDRINRHVPAYGKGRKWEQDWQRNVLQSAHKINTPRLIIDWLPPDLARRFPQRLRRNMEV